MGLEVYVRAREHASDRRTGTLATSPLRLTGTLSDGTAIDVTVPAGEHLELRVEELALSETEGPAGAGA